MNDLTREDNMTKTEKTVSPGLAFMQTFARSCPRTLGDRERCAAMHEAMSLAIRNRFVFALDDAEALNRLNLRTCVGVFRALDFYSSACVAGGTYARMWEKHFKQKPWLAAAAVVPQRSAQRQGIDRVLHNNRVAPGIGVLLPEAFHPESDDDYGARFGLYQGQQVWWCTSQNAERIVLCRYRLPQDHRRLYVDAALISEGSPEHIRKLSRQEWAQWAQAASSDETQTEQAA